MSELLPAALRSAQGREEAAQDGQNRCRLGGQLMVSVEIQCNQSESVIARVYGAEILLFAHT